jgi:uncharacterized protein with HEPN domain
MARSDAERAQDILGAIADIQADTAGMDLAAFSDSPQTIRSVLYSIGVIGEAAKNLSDDFKSSRPGVPWRAVAGMRDRIVHEYFRTNVVRIWDVVTDDLEPLQAVLKEK